MEISANPAATSPGGANPGATFGPDKKELSSDFETFLRMLTAQMQNQDPLKPIESSDFASQLATFSGVEQQVRTNDLLQSLSDRLGGGGMTQLAGWVGMEARAPVPAKFGGQPLTVAPHPAEGADQAVLVVHDSSGAEVQRLPVVPSQDTLLWAGVQDNGTPFESGVYSFNLESYREGKLLGTSIAETYSTVREVRQQNGKSVLILDNGSRVTPEEVTALRQGDTGGLPG